MSGNDLLFDDDVLTPLEMFEAEMKTRQAPQESISAADLDDAMRLTVGTLPTGWSTGGGRLQQFVSSLWNRSHLINLYDLSYGLDARLTDAIIILFRAGRLDVLNEDLKRRILTESGEFARWEESGAVHQRMRMYFTPSDFVGRRPYDTRNFGTALPKAPGG